MQASSAPAQRIQTITFVVAVVLVISALAGVAALYGRSSAGPQGASGGAPGPYGPNGNDSGSIAAYPQVADLPPLPPELVAGVPSITAEYQNEPFSGMQGSSCWKGDAETNQTAAPSPQSCSSVPVPISPAGMPTIAVYPNASISFFLGDGQGGLNTTANLYAFGGDTPLASEIGQGMVNLGSLPEGTYLLVVNASAGSSYTSDYFAVQQINSANFVTGPIKISIGSPEVYQQSIGGNLSGGGTSYFSFVGLESWPLTLSSATVVRGVNLSAISEINGNWVRFVPSEVPQVGPNGTIVNMLLAGSVRPFVNNDISNASLIIQATGAGGMVGQAALPLEGQGGFVVVNSFSAQNQAYLAPGSWMVFAANQSNYGDLPIIYDPGNGSNQSVPLAVTVAGFYNSNGTITPMPTWLQFSVPTSSTGLSVTPLKPMYVELTYVSSSAAPVGPYTLVLDVSVGGTAITVYMPVYVSPPISMG